MKLSSLFGALLIIGATLHGQPLSVAITQNPTNLHGFFLDVFNLEPGQTYGIGAKNMPSPDPFDVWPLISVFDAPAPAVRFDGAASNPQRTFIAISLNDYAGASVRIASPAAGSVVSGDIPVRVVVADVLPLLTVEVFVGGTIAGVILPGQGGVMNLPTYRFPNGEQEIWVRVVNEGIDVDTDGDGVPDSPTTFASLGSVSVTFSNEVYMENFSPLYSAYGLSYYAATEHEYTFEVFRLNGELLHTQTGVFLGSVSPQWNFTDLLGNPVTDGGYVFSLTATPSEGGSAAMTMGLSSTELTASPSTSYSTESEAVTTAAQPQKFRNFSSGELLVIQSGTSLPEITGPEPTSATLDLAEILARMADMQPGQPPPLPPPPPWPPQTSATYTATRARP